jgi:hypothetical protein
VVGVGRVRRKRTRGWRVVRREGGKGAGVGGVGVNGPVRGRGPEEASATSFV